MNKSLGFIILVVTLSVGCYAAEFVSNALGSNMVLQRGPQRANIWGSSTAGATVTVTLGSQNHQATADASGKWNVLLDPVTAGGPYTIDVKSSSGQTATLSNVLFGDVYVCSGQSNMQFTTSLVFNATAEVAKAAAYSNIRVFTVGTGTVSDTPLAEFDTITQPWSVADPKSIGGPAWQYMSAVCWFFGKDLYDRYKVPIGLVSSNWGGTYVQAWSSPDALAKCKEQEKPLIRTVSGDVTIFSDKIGANPNQPSVLWNAMIVPLLPMTITGATWYQGEANAGQPQYYACAFPAMISDWRMKWGGTTSKEFGFYFAQLAPWLAGADGTEALIRLGQMTATKLINVDAAVTIDAGDPTSPEGSIHPRDKQVVGERLAMIARVLTYKEENLVYKGPEAISWQIVANGTSAQVSIAFDKVGLGSGLVLKPTSCPANVPANQCAEFEIGGSDGKWVRASPTIVTNHLVLKADIGSAGVVGARYGWANYPITSLYNREGFPAYPFAFPDPIKPQ